ncbi:DUF192 domain-containing protein [Geomonas oryzae]|uniref:DUF192 domain-containing protein n=1 Tax=Geomonas oryzae TaxID=2364273 RepID=UPI00100B8ED3|nr:DUF192 domain-containing protein [Geomonas oryzae]
MRAIDATSGREIASRVAVADTFFSRLKGLLGREELPSGEAMWIRPCRSVHSFGMKFPIDVVFLDRDMRVVAMTKGLRPGRVSAPPVKACSVLELPVGVLDAAATVIGNRIEIT